MCCFCPFKHIIHTWSKLCDLGLCVTCSRSVRSVMNYHLGIYMYNPGPCVTCSRCTQSIISYHPGPNYTSQGLPACAPGVPGLSSTITLVQVTHPRAFWHVLQVYQVYHQL